MSIEEEQKEKVSVNHSINSLSTKDSLNSSGNLSENASFPRNNSNQQLNSSSISMENDVFNFSFENKSEAVNYSEEYINEIYTNLLQEESNLQTRPIYGYMLNQPQINEKMRVILIDWIINIHHKFNLTSQSLYTTVFIIDTYLSLKPVKKSEFQLLGLTAFLLACKTQEVYCPNFKELINSTDGACDRESILKMEKNILNTLNFDLYAPSPDDFYGILSTAFKFNSLQKNFGKYFMEYSLYDYNMIKYPPSVIAAASCYFVMKFFGIEEYAKLYSNFVVNGDCPQKVIKHATKELCFLVKNLVNCQDFYILKEKYASEKYDKVSEYCEL